MANETIQNLSVSSMGRGEMHAIKRGLLWEQRERLFSRWKERYFILTKDYLHCFKRATNNISPMGQFIFKVKLVDVEKVEWVNKKSYSAIGITLVGRESRILLRGSIGLDDWFHLLEECTLGSKERRRALRKLHEPKWDANDDVTSYKSGDWFETPDICGDEASIVSAEVKRRSRCGSEFDPWPRPFRHENRLSLLTDIDINSWGSAAPSAPSTFRGRPYRLNPDVFFLPHGDTGTMNSSRSVMSSAASFRGPLLQPQGGNLKYRERSQSDALHKLRPPDIENKRGSYLSSAVPNL